MYRVHLKFRGKDEVDFKEKVTRDKDIELEQWQMGE